MSNASTTMFPDAEVARDVVVRDILEPVATIGIEITKEERAQLFERS